MIIQCEQCQTKFKLDDSRVADKSIKVRCARCRHVFSVGATKDVPEPPAAFKQNPPVFQIEDDLNIPVAPVQETVFSFEPDTPPEEDYSDHSRRLDSFSFVSDDEPAALDSSLAPGNDFDFSLPPVDSSVTHDQGETEKDSDSFDFGFFEFGDESGDAVETVTEAQPLDFGNISGKQEQSATSAKEQSGGFDFSGDNIFGDVVSTPPEEAVSESISFDGFAASMGIENGADSQKTSSDAQEPAAKNPFSMDDIDFGEELTSVAVQQFNPEELKPNQDLLFAPLATTEAKPVPDSEVDIPEKTAPPPVQEELPPLSITSRRKESSRTSGILVFLGIVIAGLAIFYNYLGFDSLTGDRGKITQETGRISTRSIEASFIKNKQAGDLLVISGEAVNEYSKPRAAIQIKGIIFGADGKEVSSKIAFCGNRLSVEQLTTMTIDKIEAAMANQFGDSLANMEIAPGKSIPFMIVIPKPPDGSKDYGVEPVGSTVATGKDK